MPLALGIDAGGTTTTAVAVESGTEVWRAVGPAANISTGGISSLAMTLNGCPKPDAVCAGFAGLVSRTQQDEAEGLLGDLFPGTPVMAVADFEIALEAGMPDANVCVIAGTGSIVCSRFEGKVCRTGGRGFVLGDEGSGFQFGRDAFLEFLEASEESVSPDLAQAVEAVFGTRSKSEAIAALYSAPSIAQSLAALAPTLAADAENGALYALKSLKTNMAKLAHVCKQHLRRYGPDDPVLGCQGGLWKAPAYRVAFMEALPLWLELPTDSLLFDLPEPAFGAARMAEASIAN